MNVKIKENQKIMTARDCAKIFREIYNNVPEEDAHKELFYVAGLNAQNIILFVNLIAIGTINSCVPFAREAFRQAIIKNAVSIICCHNHPSGKLDPSPQDRLFTKKLTDAGRILDVKVLDHIIIGEGENFYSFSDSGLI